MVVLLHAISGNGIHAKSGVGEKELGRKVREILGWSARGALQEAEGLGKEGACKSSSK
jgi:hypothetical protein